MKKLISLLLCLLLAAMLAVPALADVIWEPWDDFYTQHRSECLHMDARFEAQTDVDVYKSPQKRTVVTTIPVGTEVYISWVWPSDVEWGYYEYVTDTDEGDGWLELSGLRRLYNADDFDREYAGEITEEAGFIPLEEYGSIYIWPYPGSGEWIDCIDSAAWDWAEDPSYYATWTDDAGHRWGHVGYYYGIQGWVCLTDPGADDLPRTAPRYADESGAPLPTPEAPPIPEELDEPGALAEPEIAEEPEIVNEPEAADEPTVPNDPVTEPEPTPLPTPIPERAVQPIVPLLVLLVALVVIVTAVILAVLIRKKRK